MNSLEDVIKGAQKLSEAAAKAQISPHAADYHYYKSFPEFKAHVDAVQKSIQNTLLACHASVVPKSSKGSSAVDWEDANEVREWVGCALDDCMEGVDAAIDLHRKAVRQQALAEENAPDGMGASAEVEPQVLPSQLGPVSNIGGAPKGLLRNLQAGRSRPQEGAVGLPVDNSPHPFQHWAPHLASVLPSAAAPALGRGILEEQASTHPFAPVLEQLSYMPSQLDASAVCPPRPLEETPIAWVDTPEALSAMASELQGEQYIAVDLEHHSYRSFQGFTCLMQLSSRTKDYVVDALALRQQIGPALIGIFANPAIVKVLHGADRDVLWLQRDFHLYLVNMFDTGQATRVLSYPSNSLAFLLEHFCGVKADKRFQLADWRARPLSPEMLDYARDDTHYLLYCYDRLKQELVNMGNEVPPSLQVQGGPPAPLPCMGRLALATVLERSRQLCLVCYEKEMPPTKQSCDDSVQRWEISLTGLQREVLFAAALWRDTVCRELDEGTGYVLPRTQLITLAQHMPDTAKDILRLLGRSASEALRSRAPALAARIHAVKADADAETAAKEAAAAAAAATASVIPSTSIGAASMAAGITPEPAGAASTPTGAVSGTAPCTADTPAAASAHHPVPTADTASTAATAAVHATAASTEATANIPSATAAPKVVLAPKPVAPIKSKVSRGAGLFGSAGNAAKKQKVGAAEGGQALSHVAEGGQVPPQASQAVERGRAPSQAPQAAQGVQAPSQASQAAEGGQVQPQAPHAAEGGQAPSQVAEGGQKPSQASHAAEGRQAPSQAAGGGQAPPQASHAAEGVQTPLQASQAAEGGRAPSQRAEGMQTPLQASQAAEGGQAPSQAPLPAAVQAAEGRQTPSQAAKPLEASLSTPSSLTAAPPSVSKAVGKAKKARGSLAGLIGPTTQPSPSTQGALKAGLQGRGAAEEGPDGLGGGQLVAQLKASLALPFPVLAPPASGGASQRNGGAGHLEGSTDAGSAQEQQHQWQQQQQQQQHHFEQHGQEVQEQGIQEEGFHDGGVQQHTESHGQGSLHFVPIPRKKDRKPWMPADRHQQGGISQASLPRVGKDALKRKYISDQEEGLEKM